MKDLTINYTTVLLLLLRIIHVKFGWQQLFQLMKAILLVLNLNQSDIYFCEVWLVWLFHAKQPKLKVVLTFIKIIFWSFQFQFDRLWYDKQQFLLLCWNLKIILLSLTFSRSWQQVSLFVIIYLSENQGRLSLVDISFFLLLACLPDPIRAQEVFFSATV